MRLDATVAHLDRLIGFPTVSSDSNLDLVEYVEAALAAEGIKARRIADRSGRKASLLATIGPPDRTGIVLSAHTDVVPADEAGWTSPPFSASLRGGRIHGRGSCDMKGFIACVLAHIGVFKRMASATPIHLAFSYDEEIGCRGAPDLVAAVAQMEVLPAFCIVGEPTSLKPVSAHKGKVARRIIVKGLTGHSAMPHRAANAVTAAARIVSLIDDIARDCASGAAALSAFDPPYTTVHVGSLHGGSALNLVPDRAVIEFEIRSTPGTDVGALLTQIDAGVAAQRDRLRRTAPEADIAVEDMTSYPGLATQEGDPALSIVAGLAAAEDKPATVSFGTEAGLYSAAGIPTIVCGPGNMARAHKADEWIGLDELAAANRMMERLAQRLDRPLAEWLDRPIKTLRNASRQ
ncbi:acetylornithine deacetylase [Taklimakanibacter lacteus]|uniref:acetylornithine deacetylase n=1 Tax=Taklimakanibacter lacteus TaxID=2268456 RepID=UPI0013C4C0EA